MEKRDLYLEKFSAQIEQYSATLSRMRGKAKEVNADVKLEYLSQLEKLERTMDSLKDKHEQLKKSSQNSWEDMKKGTENAWDELKESISKATEHLK